MRQSILQASVRAACAEIGEMWRREQFYKTWAAR